MELVEGAIHHIPLFMRIVKGLQAKEKRASGSFFFYLNKSCFFECCVCSVFVDSFDCASGDSETDRFFEFRNIDFLVLKVRIATYFSCRVELSRTSCV